MRLGETYVHGKDPATARALLDAAERIGMNPMVVRTGDLGGFYVPDAVWDEAQSTLSAPAPGEQF